MSTTYTVFSPQKDNYYPSKKTRTVRTSPPKTSSKDYTIVQISPKTWQFRQGDEKVITIHMLVECTCNASCSRECSCGAWVFNKCTLNTHRYLKSLYPDITDHVKLPAEPQWMKPKPEDYFPRVRLEYIPKKGFGLVAMSTIRTGQVIFKELPLVYIYNPPDKGKRMWVRSQTNDLAKSVLDELNAGPTGIKDRFYALYNRHKMWSIEPPRFLEEQIWDSNAFNNAETGYGAVFELASRLNHDCFPNARIRIDDNLKFKCYALKDIKAGQEVCVTYLGEEAQQWPAYERRKRLAEEYQFFCTCRGCELEETVRIRKYKGLSYKHLFEQLPGIATWRCSREDEYDDFDEYELDTKSDA